MRELIRLLREHGDVEEHPYTLARAVTGADNVTDNRYDQETASLADVADSGVSGVSDLVWDAGEPVMLYVFRHSGATAL